jgi:hypothetical protein
VPYEEIKMMILEVDETHLAESMIQVNKQAKLKFQYFIANFSLNRNL